MTVSGLFIVAIVLMAFCTIRGLRRGIAMLIYGVAAWLFVLLFILFFKTPIYNMYVGNERVYNQIYEVAFTYVDRYVPKADAEEKSNDETVEQLKETIPKELQITEEMVSKIDIKKLEEYGIKVPKDFIKEGVTSVRDGIVDKATRAFVDYLIQALAVLTAYLIAKLICVIVKIIIITISESAIARGPVHLLGGIFGLGESILYIWIILYVISMIEFTNFGRSLASDVAGNPLLYTLDQHNLIAGFLHQIISFKFF